MFQMGSAANDHGLCVRAAAKAEFAALEIDTIAARAEMLGGQGQAGGVMGYWIDGDGKELVKTYAEWVEPVAS